MDVLEKTILILHDNQKKFYKELQDLKKKSVLSYEEANVLESYEDFSTCSFTNGLYKRERNEIIVTKDNVIHTTTKCINDFKCITVETFYNLSSKTVKYTNYINCNKEEFNLLWN